MGNRPASARNTCDDVSLSTIQPAATFAVSQILPPIGKQFIALALGGTYYVEKPEHAQDRDLRAMVSVVFP